MARALTRMQVHTLNPKILILTFQTKVHFLFFIWCPSLYCAPHTQIHSSMNSPQRKMTNKQLYFFKATRPWMMVGCGSWHQINLTIAFADDESTSVAAANYSPFFAPVLHMYREWNGNPMPPILATPIQDDDDEVPHKEDQPNKKAHCTWGSKSKGGVDYTLLGSYSGPWFDILNDAKDLYCLHVHTWDPFPSWKSRNTVVTVTDILNEAMNNWAKVNPDFDLDDGTSTISYLVMRLTEQQMNIAQIWWRN